MRFVKNILVIGLVIISAAALSIGVFTYFRPQEMIRILNSLTPQITPTPIQIKGIGVIGDSLSDEYRADDNRGQTYALTTLNWVEILQKTRHLPFGKWQYYEEPRREGYEYNFSRTSADLKRALIDGQHTQLAKYIKAGKVNVVIVFIGANDFFPYIRNGYESIYNGSMGEAAIIEKVNTMVADERTVIETLQKAGDVRILLVKIPDWSHHPAAIIAFPDPVSRQRVTNVIKEINRRFDDLALEKTIATADPNEFNDLLQAKEKNNKIEVGGVALNKYLPSDDPHSLFLDDILHPGTIYNGLFADYLIGKMNVLLGTKIKPLTDKEIVSAAGL